MRFPTFVFMKLQHSFSFIVLFLFILLWSCKDNTQETETPVIEPGTALHYYNRGLDTSDLEEKLRLYNKGLGVISGKRDTVLTSLLEGKVYALFALQKPEEALYWGDSLLKAAEVLKDTYYLAKGNYWLYRLKEESNDLESAYEHLFRSKQLYLQMQDSMGAGWRSIDMALLRYDSGDYAGSQESAIEALQFIDKEKYPHLISSVYNIIGLSYLDRGFNEEAKKEFQNALEYAVNEKDSLSFLHNYALALNNQEKYDESLQIFEKIVDSDAPSQQSMNRFMDNYAHTLWLQDSTRKVDSLHLKALKRREAAGDLIGLAGSYMSLSDYYAETDKEKARKYAEALLQNSRETSNKATELLALKKLIALTPSDEDGAYVERFIFLNDSLKKEELKAKHVFAKVEFDENQKQKQITQLRETAAKQALVTERLKWRTAFISLLLLFTVVAGGAFFYFFRQRSRRERLKEVYKTESRIARRIHDELANDLYGLMNRLSPVVPPKTVDQLEEIYKRTRNISRENAEIDTGENFPSFLKAMLSDNTGSAKLILRGEQQVNWEKLSEEKKIVLYRVLQELMINMKKHSNAPLVAIVFDQQQKNLQVKYSDTGKGSAREELQLGNGLKNVKNRMSSVGGKISFRTGKGEGFKVDLSLAF